MAKSMMDFVMAAREQVENIDLARFDALSQQHSDLLILDVREESEYAAGRVPGAYLVPRGILEGAADLEYKKRDPVLSQARSRPIVCYCASGGRSMMAAATLLQMGFEKIYNLAGGFELWSAEDRPVEKQ